MEENEKVKPFYNRFPKLENFKSQIKQKSDFPIVNREILVTVLKQQYEKLNNPTVSTHPSLENINALKEPNTFTVTTGHQLSLFTGPLYFIYKIVSAVNLAEKLNQEYTDKHFVPVYWMASEDHDFAEINHIHFAGGRMSWNKEASGPVGRLETQSLAPVIKALKEVSGIGTHAEEIIELLEKAYLKHSNLADATRYLVHALFGDKGLVVIDADDASLKSLAIPYFKQDLFDHKPKTWVNTQSEALGEAYFNQVHAREINLFYIKDGLRERIERENDNWLVLNTNVKWSREELEEELLTHPERFSPNVILRPLYQELILPNLAYIGGGGELAYWFQLQKMFDGFEIPFPMLNLRNSVLGISEKQWGKMQKMELKATALFKPLHEIQNRFAAQSAPVDPSLDPYEQKLEQMFDDLEKVAHLTDRSMLGAVNAQRQKQLNGLENLKKKLLRAEKRKNKDLMQRLEELHGELFPNGSLQERHDNLVSCYLRYGKNWIEGLYPGLDPLRFEFVVSKWK